MRTDIISSTPLPTASPSLRHCLAGRRKFPPISPIICAVADNRHHPSHGIGTSPEPPWRVLPPRFSPENPFFSPSPDLHVPPNGAGFPFSLRLMQRKRLALAGIPSYDAAAAEGPVARAVAAVVGMIGELQGPVIGEDDLVARVSGDRRDSFVWLFRRVFANSPNLVPLVLLLLANFIADSTHSIAHAQHGIRDGDQDLSDSPTVVIDAVQEEEVGGGEVESASAGTPTTMTTTIGNDLSLKSGNFNNWFDIGIWEGSLDPTKAGLETSDDRRRRAYERAIAEGGATSLILSNYAQFLYRVAHDQDRAEEYFQWAAMAEPRDAEAMSRYAFFLWEERGDVSGAEEMFLEAIDAEPGNFYHSSNYAFFLWKSGAEDTCYALSSPPPLPPPSCY